MPRAISLKPAFREAREKAGLSPWIVNVPSFLSHTGKRQELFFTSKTAAQAECDRLKAKKHNFGASLSLLSASQMVEAAKAFQMLKPHDLGLLKVVADYLAIHEQRKASITFAELCNQYLSAKASKNEKHLRGLRNSRDRFPSLHEKLVSEIDHKVLGPLVYAVTPGSRNMVLRHLRAIFNLGIKRQFLTENPVDRLDFVDVKRKEVETIRPDAVAKMLEHALQNDLQLVPFLTLGFFTGIRPEELRLMLWSDIDIATKAIVIRPEISKTNRRRFPELSPNAVAWLEAYRHAGGTMEGPIIDLKEDALYAHRQLNRLAAGVTHWPNSCMRHCFCSFWLAQHKDVNRLVLLSGHDSPDVMWRNYHAGVKESEAQKYWAIVPPAESAKVIPFERTA
jgi:integrase